MIIYQNYVVKFTFHDVELIIYVVESLFYVGFYAHLVGNL